MPRAPPEGQGAIPAAAGRDEASIVPAGPALSATAVRNRRRSRAFHETCPALRPVGGETAPGAMKRPLFAGPAVAAGHVDRGLLPTTAGSWGVGRCRRDDDGRRCGTCTSPEAR
jgi:hypothetical protein